LIPPWYVYLETMSLWKKLVSLMVYLSQMVQVTQPFILRLLTRSKKPWERIYQSLVYASGISSSLTQYEQRRTRWSMVQPCKDLQTGKCIITSQNHWFAIDESTLPRNVKPWFTNINDKTNEWIYFTKKNARSVQFHPESSPGPNDSQYLFEQFISSL